MYLKMIDPRTKCSFVMSALYIIFTRICTLKYSLQIMKWVNLVLRLCEKRLFVKSY